VTLDGRTVELGDKTDRPERLRFDGQPLRLPRNELHFALHKPRSVVSTMSDPEGRPTVAELLPRVEGRLFPVGRLDFGSEGLILLTSDGQLAQRLMRPAYGVEREYALKLKEPLDEKQLQRLRRGVVEGGERLTLVSINPLPSRSSHSWYSLVLTEGKNRHIRRMMSVVPALILRLKRVRIGPVQLGSLEVGEVRPLSEQEVAALRETAGSRAPGPKPRARSRPPESRSRGPGRR
jgi:23S rRNA pseudouridine2605 synthase